VKRGEDLSTRDRIIGSVVMLVLCGACGWLALGGNGDDADTTPTADVRRQVTAEAFDQQGTAEASTVTAMERGVEDNAPDTAVPPTHVDEPPATVQHTSTDDMLTYPLATGTFEIFELPKGHPTPHRFGSADEVAQYVHELVNPSVAWTEQHVKLTVARHFDDLSGGLVPSTPTGTPHPIDDEVVWVVGFRSEELVTNDRIDSVVGLSGLGDPNSPYGMMGGFEAYVVVSQIGTPLSSGIVDLPNHEGTPEPNAFWVLSDIDLLPDPP
jgi:hypothetical protein